ncbi:DUF2000 domain-containing protein [Nesterenkonia rhizosphaerae]|uniref:DUF2000 domain-containing protein n=1 Tax=Nesterenkonia rhizosphaerae TaxID=1348272 RepID=A0ABP9G3G3_9MICC
MTDVVTPRTAQLVGFAQEEMQLDLPTREVALKWVVIVNETLSPGRAANAAAAVAAATSPAVSGLLGPGSADADESHHAGLPWLGCTVVAAGDEKLRRIRSKALGRQEVFIADMPVIAQQTRVYQEYLDQISTAASEAIDYAAISLVGPRKYVERLVGGLSLLS